MDALFDLEQVLHLKKEGLTAQEENLVKAWEERARRATMNGWNAGSILTFLVTKRLSMKPRFALCAGAGFFPGFWMFHKSVESSAEHLLSLQGTRIQGELANLMLKKRQNDPWVQQRLSKYFYPEIVYNDSSADRPLYRWRYRNVSGDSVAPQSSTETDSKENDVKTPTKETKKVRASAGGVTMKKEKEKEEEENAFDLVFGVPETAEDVSQSDAPMSPSRGQTRRDKRMRRRHRHARRDEESEI